MNEFIETTESDRVVQKIIDDGGFVERLKMERIFVARKFLTKFKPDDVFRIQS